MDFSKDTPANIIRNVASCSPSELFEEVKTWTGRWLLITPKYIIPDACTFMGCFYTQEGFLSNDLLNLVNIESRGIIKPDLTGRINFFPGPLTPYSGIRRLMCNEYYDIEKRKTDYWPLLSQTDYTNLSNDERIDLVLRMYTHTLKQLEKKGKLVLALTGGYDSRATFALALRSGVHFTTYTAEIDSISIGDMLLPKRISKAENIDFRYIKENNSQRKDKEDFRNFVSYLVKDQGENAYHKNLYENFYNTNTIILRGGVWEATIKYFANCGEEPSLDSIYRAYSCDEHVYEREFSAFLNNIANDKINSMRFPYLLGRMQLEACWLSYVERGFDIYDGFISFQMCNCTELITLLLSFPEDLRKDKGHEVLLASRLAPKLKSIKYENQSKRKIYVRILNKIVRYLHSK